MCINLILLVFTEFSKSFTHLKKLISMYHQVFVQPKAQLSNCCSVVDGVDPKETIMTAQTISQSES